MSERQKMSGLTTIGLSLGAFVLLTATSQGIDYVGRQIDYRLHPEKYETHTPGSMAGIPFGPSQGVCVYLNPGEYNPLCD